MRQPHGGAFFVGDRHGYASLGHRSRNFETQILTKALRLMDEAQAIERRAATLARMIASELMRPTSERPRLTGLLVDLDEARADVSAIVIHLRRALGTSTTDTARAARGGDAMAAYARLMRTRLRLWDQVVEAAQDCIAGRDWPLIAEARPRLDVEAAQELILQRIFTRAHSAANPVPQTQDAYDLGCFPDIPLKVGRYMMLIHIAYRLCLALKRDWPLRFIDVGCGGGLKVALASQAFPVAEGLDYDPAYVAAAERNFALMRLPRCTARQGDGMVWDGYSGFDVIYFYRPMSDVDGLKVMERKIVEDARPGAIMVAPYDGFAARAELLGCTHLIDCIFIKDLPEDEAPALLAEAARMGPHITDPDRAPPVEAGWLRPLWIACQMNGIDPHWPPKAQW
jgi:protein-L-isoaspartate O-methyltransferase